MPEYRRWRQDGGTFFFTVVMENRAPVFADDRARRLLHETFVEVAAARPFELVACVLMPEHLHAIWTLPVGDADYSLRWAAVKAGFSRRWLLAGGAEQGRTFSRVRHRNRGVWQRRFWEHAIRDEDDFNRHLDYIHYNPVKHNLASCPHAWPYSSLARWVAAEGYEPTWQCTCGANVAAPPDFSAFADRQME